FEQRVLEAHNYYRGMHGAPPLILNPRMSQMATQWAQYLSATNSMFHSQKAGFGENIFFSSGASLGGSEAVTSWYREIMYYNWNYPVFSYTTGHFTQLVWKGSTYLGVGIARRGNAIHVVCNYYPAGNVPNGFWQNVSPQKDMQMLMAMAREMLMQIPKSCGSGGGKKGVEEIVRQPSRSQSQTPKSKSESESESQSRGPSAADLLHK
ncbi:Golgi-associated plant pathogenesis-related protein 1-like, partial [Drosophila eugracilis]|uniref:Golgi-associated plant pathogenesis-related protein 1-like n=1 Tax=Drosophila eugracilis TaxID=29029 RepID=UPI001BD98478